MPERTARSPRVTAPPTSPSRPVRAFVVALAFGAAIPSASAQGLDVTLYGRLNLDVEYVTRRHPDEPGAHVFRVSSNSSRFGLRGSEALGGGVLAVFQIESTINADTGGGTLAGRDSYVGFKGGFGQVSLGHMLAPYDDIHAIFGNVPTLTTTILSTAAVWAQGTSTKALGGFDVHLPNSLRWDLPAIEDFSASVQYAAGERPIHDGVISIGGFYNTGPLNAGVAWERNLQVRGAGLYDDALSVALSYSFPWADFGAVYERLQYGTPSGKLTRSFWGLGVTVPLGAGALYAFAGHAGDGGGSAAAGTRVGGLARGADSAATQYTISYTHVLSKRTLAYAGYVLIANGANASYSLNINPFPTPIGGKPAGFVVGLAHFF